MKIGLLHHSVPPVVGGVESVIAHHARLMVSDGHQVHIIAGRGGQFDKRITYHQVELVDSIHPDILEAKKSLDQGIVPPSFEKLVSVIRNALMQLIAELDILIVHNVCSLAKNLALTAALKQMSVSSAKPHFILWHHDLAWTTPRYRNELHDGYPWDLLRTDWPEVTQVVVSRLRQDELCRLLKVGSERVHVVPNGVDIEQFLKLETMTVHLIEKLALERGNPLFLLPVRITRRKNIEQAIHITAALKQHFDHPMLLVTGPLGPHNPTNRQYFEQLKQVRAELQLEESVHFLADTVNEYLPDEVISDFFHLSDALLMPSREEGFGIPLIEAGLVRMPVFCSDIAPLRELGMHQVTYFSPDEDAGVVAKNIHRVLVNSHPYMLQQRVRQEYTWNAVYQNQISPLLRI